MLKFYFVGLMCGCRSVQDCFDQVHFYYYTRINEGLIDDMGSILSIEHTSFIMHHKYAFRISPRTYFWCSIWFKLALIRERPLTVLREPAPAANLWLFLIQMAGIYSTYDDAIQLEPVTVDMQI